MINYLSIIFIGINFLLLIKCRIVHTQIIKNSKETCVKDYFETSSTNHLQICYLNDIQNHSILVWFTIGKSLNNTFDLYRFILRSIDDLLLSSVIIKTLTNFTSLVDFNNSLRIFNLDAGQYEVCIEFQSNSTTFIYQPRDDCIPIQIGKSSRVSFREDSTPLLIALASGIVIFFILVQWAKAKRSKKSQDNDEPRLRSSSVLSTMSLRQQRDRFVKKLFHLHIDQLPPSDIRQWVRNRAYRYSISTEEQEFERPKSLQEWSKRLFTSLDQSSQSRPQRETISHDRITSSELILTTNSIYTIPETEYY